MLEETEDDEEDEEEEEASSNDDDDEGLKRANNVKVQGVQLIPVSPLRLVALTVIVLAPELTERTTPII